MPRRSPTTSSAGRRTSTGPATSTRTEPTCSRTTTSWSTRPRTSSGATWSAHPPGPPGTPTPATSSSAPPNEILGPGVTFVWVTFGASIHSTVHEFEPGSRIGWYGTTSQWLAYHTWLLMPRPDGSTYVVMEETGDGASPR